ncbi:MAG: FAD-binding oxidoreductase [Bacteroidales bacterium]|jgi:ferredoxin--NADP+ reductase|nr:FAD-binding oxidoreductase [Bacteroidales bacterium]
MNTPANIPLIETILNDVNEISKDVFVLSFLRNDEFRSGQMLAIALKPDDQPRLYSIASENKDKNYRILFNIQHQGYLTPRLSKVKVGDSLFISKPFGSFYGTEDEDFWIAAGTGIAPFISMLESGLAENKTLIHGGREENSFYYASVFAEKLKEKYIRCSSLIKDEVFYNGRITAYLKQTQDISLERNYYICGGSEFVVDVRDILIHRGVPYHQIIAEIYF